MSALEKIAYLRGLIEGQNITENVGLSKFHEALLGALDSIAEELDDVTAEQEDMREYIEDLEDEMAAIMGDESEIDGGISDSDDPFDDEEEIERITCPSCQGDTYYHPDAFDEDEDLLCRHCSKPFKQ